MHRLLSIAIALSFFAFTALTQPYQAGDEASETVWITIGADVVPVLQTSLQSQGLRSTLPIVDIRDGVVVTQVYQTDLFAMGEVIHHRFKRCGGYIAHANKAEAIRAMNNNRVEANYAQEVAYTIDNASVVNAILADLNQANISSRITILSSYNNRYYTSQTGVQASNWIRDLW